MVRFSTKVDYVPLQLLMMLFHAVPFLKEFVMKLEFLNDLSDGGRFQNQIPDQLVRLYDFSQIESSNLKNAIQSNLIQAGRDLDLHLLPFVVPVNCRVRLSVSETNEGLMRTEDPDFFVCRYTKEEYGNMIERISLTTHGYNWLDEFYSGDVAFLFSVGGSW